MNAVAAKVLGALHESEPIYAVLDGARSPSVQAYALSTGAPGWCLHRGELPEELQEVAPYLRRLGRGHAQTDDFFSEAWGAAWGVLFTSAAPSKELRRHLRRFLRVRTGEGSVLVFRWFDPRVLRAFLPTLTMIELRRFFGPIQAFAAESDDGGSFELFRLTERGLSHQKFGRAPEFKAHDLTRITPDLEEPEGNDPASASRHHLLWTLSAASMAGLHESINARFLREMVREIGRAFPAHGTKLGLRMSGQIERGMAEALRGGLAGPAEMRKFLHLWFEADFNLDKRWPGAAAILESKTLPGFTKVSLLAQMAG